MECLFTISNLQILGNEKMHDKAKRLKHLQLCKFVFGEVLDTISKEVTSNIASLFVAQMQYRTRGVQYRPPV